MAVTAERGITWDRMGIGGNVECCCLEASMKFCVESSLIVIFTEVPLLSIRYVVLYSAEMYIGLSCSAHEVQKG